MGWIDLSEDGDTWRAVVKTVMKFRVPLNSGKSRGWLKNYLLLKDSELWTSSVT